MAATMISLLLATDTANAKPRTTAQMKQAAKFILARHTGLGNAAPANIKVKEITRDEGYVIYSRESGEGFAVISTDDVAPEVLGYSDSKITSNITNENFLWWLRAVNDVVKTAAKNNTTIKNITKPDPDKYDATVDALCTSKWGQEEPYWNMCPMGNGGRCMTGCVATSTAQVLYFHKGPKNGVGTRTIYYPANNTSGTPVTADFENDIYDWDNMLDTYTTGSYNTEQANAVALLMRDCGVSTNMDYAPDGSGAYHDQTADGLNKYFGLTEAKYVFRPNFSEQEWMEMIYDQISRRLPIIYGGDDWQGGHSFVLDGYDADGRVHINWGWEGSDDSYYDIALLNPSGYQFSRNQDAVINIVPEGAIDLKSDSVEMEKAGILQSLIDEENFYKYDTLKIKGAINGTDLKTIRVMAGRDEYGEKTDGKLRVLDLSEAKITVGGDAYLMESGSPLKISNDNVLPKKAFFKCASLRGIILPKGIKSFGAGAFAGCSRLSDVTLIPAEDADFKIKDNILYSLDETTIIGSLPKVNTELYISGKVTKVDDFAFSGRGRISKLTLGAQLTYIGEGAFASCAGLSEIRIVSKTPLTALGAGVFENVNKTSCKLYVRAGNTDKFKSASQWGEFTNIIEYGTTIKARNAMREYGEENPKMGYSISGDFVDGTPEVTCDATPESPAGRYPIHIKAGTITEPTVEYEDGKPVRVDTIVISTQHDPDVTQAKIHDDMVKHVIEPTIPAKFLQDTKYFINPTGRFVIGGPQGDAGLTGRKIIVDTYGGMARHGGGAFSGKDPTKVDRSAAYAARYVAKNIVAAGIADRCEIQLAYAIGVARPVSIFVDTFGTGKISDEAIVALIRKHFELRPAGIIDMLDLRRPIYKQTAAYGHFGRTDVDLPWEHTDKAEVLKKEAGI